MSWNLTCTMGCCAGRKLKWNIEEFSDLTFVLSWERRTNAFCSISFQFTTCCYFAIDKFLLFFDIFFLRGLNFADDFFPSFSYRFLISFCQSKAIERYIHTACNYYLWTACTLMQVKFTVSLYGPIFSGNWRKVWELLTAKRIGIGRYWKYLISKGNRVKMQLSLPTLFEVKLLYRRVNCSAWRQND